MPESPERILSDVWARLEAGRARADHAFRTAALATADALGRPDVRTIVLRHVDAAARRIDFQTDRRSPKFDTLHKNASAAWLFYDRGVQLQLRIATTAIPHTHDDIADAAWAAMPEAARRPYCGGDLPSEPIAGPDAAMPTVGDGRVNFAVVRCMMESIEWLHLEAGVWRRMRFTWPNGEIRWQWLAP